MPIHGYPGNVITANPVAPTSTVATGVWTTEQQLKAVAAGNWPTTIPAQQISRSLRFYSPDSAYLNRTPASASNRRTWSWSGWVKRGALGSAIYPYLITAYDSSGARETYFNIEGDCLRFAVDNTSSGNIYLIQTTQVFRDPSAWYHIMVVLDTTQATTSDRLKMYVNGTQITAFSTANYPAQNYDATINLNVIHNIGRSARAATYYYDGYMTEVNFIDGQALTPASFGQTNTSTGVWEPIPYIGTYGTNGFYVNFSDNSNTTAATLGKDYSGNGNNWTPNNFSVTAGVGNDSLVDSPTSYGTDTGVGGEVRGNYCTFNPLNVNSSLSCTNGNLTTASSAADVVYRVGFATMAMKSPTYFECTLEGITNYGVIGIGPQISVSTNTFVGSSAWANSVGFLWGTGDTVVYYNSTNLYTLAAAPAANSIIQFAYDPSTGKVWVGKDGTWYNSGNPSTGANPIATISTSVDIFPASSQRNTGNTTSWNFGQRAFAYTAPSGFKALCTQNLPTPTIGATSTTQANDYFNPVLYTGNGSTQSITGVGFQPDWVWIKDRSAGYNHELFDAVRGALQYIASNTTSAESTLANSLTSFNSDGFSLGSELGSNTNNNSYVAWNWNAGGSNATNTAGTITSTVRANTTSGFSIATFTQLSGSPYVGTVGHGLGVAPSMVIIKDRSIANGWLVYHASLGATQYLVLNSTAAAATGSNAFNNTAPTSTVFTTAAGSTYWGNAGATAVAYCFAAVAGYSAFGSYVGNGSSDGPFVYTGFRPRYVMIKISSGSTGSWWIWDSARNTYNVATNILAADSSGAEISPYNCDFLSNGFKLRDTTGQLNGSGYTIIYAAFAESPFKYALAR